MIGPQQQHGELFLQGPPPPPPPPPVFGKPWYWQRSSSAMESSRSLAQVIMEMRDEIKKLEAENRELRGDGGHGTPGDPGTAARLHQAGLEENLYVNLRRNVSAPLLEGQYKEPTVMTVRRYSTSSNLSGVIMREEKTDRGRRTNSGWERLQDEMQHAGSSGVFGSTATDESEKVTNRHSLQEYVHKNRTKVKTVTFLLPVDDIYTSRPVLKKHLEEPKVTHLASITETDS